MRHSDRTAAGGIAIRLDNGGNFWIDFGESG